MENSSRIVQLFAKVAENTDQCYDFDIQGNLDLFMRCERNQLNFSEAAFLIFDAARIYGRKVDYVEQILLDFNRRSATNIANAIAEKQKELDETDNNAAATATGKKDKRKDEQEKREKEKEKALKRAKRMCKVTNKIEFKPKPFTIGTPLQISLNLHEERSELDLEDDYDQVRMKNVFPRINVLQSNLQNNNTFYDNLNIEEHCENLDALRDFRIFMDTIDEPIYMRPSKGHENDPKYEEECNRARERANQKHSNLYLSAEYVKENYGVTLKDNSDYLNMLKYNEEVERLNLRKLSIEQLTKLKVGTYLNNILHGNKHDGKIPEHDSGIDDMYGDTESHANISDTLADEIDAPMTDISAMDTTNEADSCIGSVNTTLDTSVEQPNTSTDSDIPSAESTLNTSAEQSNATGDSILNSSTEPNTSNEESKVNESDALDRNSRQSLDDGIGGSLPPTSPSRMSEFGGFDSADLTGNNINTINDILHSAEDQNEVMSIAPPKIVKLETNIFQLPENLLRRTRLFHLTEEFDLWVAARKRKIGLNPKDPPSCGKLLKLSSGDIIRTDQDSEADIEEFLGFDENNEMRLESGAMVIDEQNPAQITNRTCSSDSGISPEKVLNADDANAVQTVANTSEVNDSGVADLNSTEDLNSSTETANQTAQETDLSNISDGNIVANSTKIFNETASILTGMDSGFDEMASQLTVNNTTVDGDITNTDAAMDSNLNDTMPECLSPILPDEPPTDEQTPNGNYLF